MERIRINDGSKSYEIVNQEDKVLGVFTFNPTDTGIIERYNDALDGLEEVMKELGTGDEKAIVIASNAIKEKIDFLFGYDASRTFFSITGPLTPLSNGQIFVESVLEGIRQVIEAEMDVRLKKVRQRMDKYTDSYK